MSGSAGKTTVKELTASILAKLGPTAKNYKNFNNHIGLPLSMLEASEEDRFWVMELGISAPGEMEPLAAIAERAPQTLEDLQGISGIGAKKLEAYGAEVLRVSQ